MSSFGGLCHRHDHACLVVGDHHGDYPCMLSYALPERVNLKHSLSVDLCNVKRIPLALQVLRCLQYGRMLDRRSDQTRSVGIPGDTALKCGIIALGAARCKEYFFRRDAEKCRKSFPALLHFLQYPASKSMETGRISEFLRQEWQHLLENFRGHLRSCVAVQIDHETTLTSTSLPIRSVISPES